MTWRQWTAARQLLAEEHLGIHVRASAHAEDEQFTASLAAARRSRT
jgi:hypothetical protein